MTLRGLSKIKTWEPLFAEGAFSLERHCIPETNKITQRYVSQSPMIISMMSETQGTGFLIPD